MKSMFHNLICILVVVFMISAGSSSAQVAVVSGGVGAPAGTGENGNNNAGGDATGLGCGGGGGSWWGGTGGAGKFGGGGAGAGGYFYTSPMNWAGGEGGQGVVVIAYYNGATFLNSVVLTSGSSVTVGAGITSAKVWAVGGGGGGAGATNDDGTAGGGGAAGGLAYVTKLVSQGDAITYSLGSGGKAGHGATAATSGGITSVTIAGTTIYGNGGGSGKYNNLATAAGGTYSGGDGGSSGGTGAGSTGDDGGGGGGAIGAANGTQNGNDGGTGANSNDISGLFAACSSASISNTPMLSSFAPTSGLTGTVVTITGSGFTGASNVRFGGINATSFTVNSATEIVATLASTSVTGSVSVTLPFVTVSKPIYFFTAPSLPAIDSFTPTTATTGAEVNINGNNFLGITSVSFGGTPALSFSVSTNFKIVATVAAGTSGNVSVTSSAGTASLAGFVYSAPPTPNVSSYTPTSASEGQTVSITGTNFSGASAVSFGGTAASSYIVNSATSISAIVAAGTSGNVSVTTSAGTSILAGFTFVDPVQASGITFSGIQETQMNIGWTIGNGTKRAVFVKAGTGTATPSDYTTYAASSAFGSGTQIATTGWYCVSNNTGNSVALIGLVAGTQYTVQVFEYNGAAGSEKYNATTATDNPKSQSTSGSSSVPSDPSSVTATLNPICNGFSTQLTANGVDGTVYWYTGSCDGTQVATGNTYTVSPATTISYYARNYSNSQFSVGCASVSVTVNQSSFTAGPFTIADLQASGTNIKWYAASSGGTALSSSIAISNGTTYYASQTVNGVESTARLNVTATVDPTPCAPSGSATQSFSTGATVASLQATGSNIRWYADASGGTALASSTALVNGTHYYATQTVSCTESATRFDVSVILSVPN
ncbi:MAG: IPT/TIG domain-containing protein [Bacteroidia bacterium]